MATFEKRVKQLEQVSCSKEEHSYCDVLIIPGGNGDLYTYEEHAAMLARKRFDKVPTSESYNDDAVANNSRQHRVTVRCFELLETETGLYNRMGNLIEP